MSARRRGALSIPTAALAVLVFVVCLVFGVSSVARAEGETGAATEAAAAARAGESDESSLEADDSEATAFEVTTPEGIKVSASVPEGALPEGAELHAELVESEDDTQAVADELEKADVAYDGFLALDVYFTDADGNEVEPTESVDVRFELPEGTVPEGAEDLAVHHLAEAADGTVAEVEAVADDADATEGTVAVQDDATVDAEFTVESFSTFTIRWNDTSSRQVTVHYVDESGQEIAGPQTNRVNASNREWIDLDEYGKSIEGHTYLGAHLGSYTGTEVRWLTNRSGTWYYSNSDTQPSSSGGSRWRDANRNVYLVYSKNPTELTTVDTVDSTAEGVHMYMRDFPGKAYAGGEYGKGDVKEGMSTKTVNESGWPQLSDKADPTYRGTSFAELFFGDGSLNAYGMSERYAVNHLFLQSYYDEDGTFYYSSFDNFATLQNDNDSDFTVYEQLGSPSNQNEYFYQRGNFMPYNTLNTNKVINHNLYDSEGNRLETSDERYNEEIYGFNESKNNFHFGMYVWADFYQPKDGLVESNDGTTSEDMIFEFTGDDDMWVYIDGVLVLDLGGIHDAQSGSINFATGEVRYTDTETDKSPEWHSTTIRAQYEAAGKENNYNWDGDTYADGSSHRIQIFYMERGEGASNLKISFNLKTIPDGQLSVAKDVENYYAPQVADIEYTMQVTVDGEAYANAKYTILGNEDTVLYTDSDGQFKLKHDQTATFPDLQVGNKVTVKEVGSTDTGPGVTIKDNYDISYTVTDGAGHTTGDTGEDGTVTAEMPGYGSIRVTVNNKATYTRPLKVVKNFDGTEGNKVPEGFEATYTLYEVDENEDKLEPAIGSVKYSEFTNGEYTFWLDTDKNYTVVETFEDGDNKGDTASSKWSSVTTTTNDPAEGTEASDGIVHLDENDVTEGNDVDTITLTNRYGLTIKDVLKVTKTENGSPLVADMFEFTIEPQASGEGVTAVTAQQAAEKAGLTLADEVYAYSNEGSAEPGVTGLARMGNEITFTTDDIGKTYVYEYAETGRLTDSFKHEYELSESDFIFDEAQYRVELAVSDKDGKLQVTMTKLMRNTDKKDWEKSGEPVVITSENCDCSEGNPLMTVDFENAYINHVELNGPVGIEKTLEGAELKDSMFRFTVTAQETETVSADDAAIKAGSYDEDGKAIASWNVVNTLNDAGDSVFAVIGSMSFSADDAGRVYQYLVIEDDNYIGDGYNRRDYLYDDTEYLIQFRPVIATSEGGDKSLEVELWVAERNGGQGDFSDLAKVGVFAGDVFMPVDSQAQSRAISFDPQYNLEFNNKVSRASLSISKVLEGNGFDGYAPKDAVFSIQIELKDKDGNPVTDAFTATGVEGQEEISFNENGVATVTLKADETIIITGLPVGATCKVTEPEDMIPGGFQLQWIWKANYSEEQLSTREAIKKEYEEEIQASGNDVEVCNAFIGYGLSIFKGELAYDENGDIDLDENNLPYADPEHPLSGAVFEISALNDDGKKQAFGSLETDENGKAVFMGLPDEGGQRYPVSLTPGTYYIKEVKVPSGYQLLGYEITLMIADDGKAEISIPQGEGKEPIVKELGYDNDGNLLIEVANKPNPGLPSSGSNGTLLMMSTGFAAIVLAGTYLSKRFGHLWN